MSDPNAQATVARGHNLVVFAPPSPSATGFVLAGIIDRLISSAAKPPSPRAAGVSWLVLAPGEAVPEWSRVAQRIRAGRSIAIAGGLSRARIGRLLAAGTLDVLITSPTAALDLVSRAGLKLERLAGILVIWPELWGPDPEQLLAPLFQDLPRELQRVIVTTDPEGTAGIVERYGWRAPVTDRLGAGQDPRPPVRTTPVGWERRLQTLGELIEALDPDSLAVWTADPAEPDLIQPALAAAGASAQLTSEIPGPASLVVAYDLPSPRVLDQLAAAGPVLLLVAPGTESYVARLAPRREPVHPGSALRRAREDQDRILRRITDILDRGPHGSSLLALAPLFERFEATAVAAALFELWQEAGAGPGSALEPAGETRQRLWVGIGKRDGATPHDLVATLTRECRVPKEAIGRIEIRETFSLVEIAESAGPDQVAERLTGKTIRKRRLVARVDKQAARRGR